MDKRIPIVEENLHVHTRTVDSGGVRIRKHVEEHLEPIELSLHRDAVAVRRVPVDRVVDEPVPTREDGDTLIIPVHEERLVRQWVLVEELHVTRRTTQARATGEVTLRRESVSFERTPPENSDAPPTD
ncbi:DUF2382 domain-containing protein [Cognatilysobacter bugurensis]|uniref:DUF2382 domain-containing protein n=1 Tax=Cognatilysobacter bugurensis TaxID=543356 RepID=A0A918W9B5_9GAMM|nr:DUF2382 domain-containing protein [Lysobacter bugurensis]GHA83961.1 hypothetical protein GCM10007067_22650 [Lysobacter bugurensis]